MNYIKLAWRNIWRNKRRTLLTAASVFMAVFLALLVRSIQTGWFDNLINVVTESYTGHIQVHKKGYWNDKDINNSMYCNDSLLRLLQSLDNVKNVVPRLEYFALSSFNQQTKGVLLIGTDPAREDNLTHLSRKIIQGKYLDNANHGILVAQRLASYLNIKTGDTLVLIGQGFHGVSAVGKYPVRGIIHFPSPQLDNQMVYMNLPTAQEFFGADNRITSVSFMLNNPDRINQTVKVIEKVTHNDTYEVMRWDEMLVEVMQQLQAKTAGGNIIIAILYMIVGFGIFGTVIMMTNERIREFGVVVSVGMQKTRLAIIVLLEMIFIGMTGVVSGVAASLPIMLYYSVNPIHLTGNMAKTFINYGIEPLMPLAFKSTFIIGNVIIVLIIISITCTYPVRKILRLNVVEALRK